MYILSPKLKKKWKPGYPGFEVKKPDPPKGQKTRVPGFSGTRVPNTIQEHIKAVHEGVKFKCESCNKEFNKKQIMRRHMKYIHEGQRNFSCKICAYQAYQSSDLKLHVKRIHKDNTNSNFFRPLNSWNIIQAH